MILFFSRWLRKFNLKPASEAKQRELIKCVEKAIIKSIMAPFTFTSEKERGKYIIGTAAWTYIENFKEHVLGRIDSL